MEVNEVTIRFNGELRIYRWKGKDGAGFPIDVKVEIPGHGWFNVPNLCVRKLIAEQIK